MRLGTGSPDKSFQLINQKVEKIQEVYLQKITEKTQHVNTKVMLGDSTIVEQNTFDPSFVSDLYQKIANKMGDWTIQDVSVTNNDDIRRIFFKFEKRIENYLLSGHMSIQFHVLLYYKPDQRVIDCQKELSDIVDTTKDTEQQLSDTSDQMVQKKLNELGHDNLDHQRLFEIFFKNDELREKIYQDIENGTDANLKDLATRKTKLFDELDSLLRETYQMVPILIDDVRLVAGEEGCLCAFDLEFIKNGSKMGLFDSNKMPERVKLELANNLDNVCACLLDS